MEVKTEERSYTYEDYAKLPEGSPYQLIGGQLVLNPAPTTYHQEVSKKIGFLLYKYAECNNCLGVIYIAPVDVYLEESETYQPDIIFITNERRHIIGKAKINGAPDLIIEILFPSTAYYDLCHKKSTFEKHGVKEYWIIDPMEKSVEIYNNINAEFVLSDRKSEKGSLASKIVNGFAFDIEDIF